MHSKRKDVGKGYHSLAENLVKFDELGKLPGTLQLGRTDEGQGTELQIRLSGIRHEDSVTTGKGTEEGHESPERNGVSCKCSTDCGLQVCPLRLLAFSVVKQLEMMAS